MDEPFGENCTALTAAEWRLGVAKYLTRGGLAGLDVESGSKILEGRIWG
jgi:hypothetical protein